MLYGVRIAELDEQSYRYLLWNHRPLTDFWMTGPGTVKRLEAHGIYTMAVSYTHLSTNGMKQLLSVPVSGQNFGLSAMTEEIYATFQIESIRSTRSLSLIHI